MARITCRTPSTGKPVHIYQNNVTTSYTTIAEAPDFSVPDPSNKFPTRDILDASRAIRPGEIFFLTPIAARNKDSTTKWIEVQLLLENAITINFGKISVPAGDTVYIPIQGRSLFKRDAAGANGDRIQIRAESNSVFDVWAAAEEKLSNEHVGAI